eukprot:SAG31_NODE_55_length_29938_cov_9.154027_38_plen_155_part_00
MHPGKGLLSRFCATIREIRDFNREKCGTNRESVCINRAGGGDRLSGCVTNVLTALFGGRLPPGSYRQATSIIVAFLLQLALGDNDIDSVASVEDLLRPSAQAAARCEEKVFWVLCGLLGEGGRYCSALDMTSLAAETALIWQLLGRVLPRLKAQ